MDMGHWLTLAGLALTASILLVTVTRQISGIETRSGELIRNLISSLKKEFYEQNDKLRLEVAETIKPLRSLVTDYERKHYELELYIRDNYIEVSTFKEALSDIKDLISEVKERVEKIGKDDTDWRKERRAIDNNSGD